MKGTENMVVIKTQFSPQMCLNLDIEQASRSLSSLFSSPTLKEGWHHTLGWLFSKDPVSQDFRKVVQRPFKGPK